MKAWKYCYYVGDEDPKQQAECIAELARVSRGKRLIDLPLPTNWDGMEKAQRIGKVRYTRFWNAGPLNPQAEWINRFDVAWE